MGSLWKVVPKPGCPGEGEIVFNWHPGQRRAWNSKKRFINVLAGTQGGKTTFGPPWLHREIVDRGPGDYMIVTPTYPLLVKKCLPEFLRLFRTQLKLGEYQSQMKIFTFSKEGNLRTHGRDEATQVFFGHATDPESLESATAKAVWLDEAGQKKFRLGSWEAIIRRLSINQGRALITTTPYDLGWLKQLLFDPWEAAKRNHPTIDVIQFDSAENPSFPREEFERAQREMPRWKFDLFYRAKFTRPAGLIYSCFDHNRHKCPRFDIPLEWPRFIGLDFGGVNTAAIFFAQEIGNFGPTGRYIAYREYKAGERSAAEHIFHLMKGEPRVPICAGGSKSEGQWRREFSAGGTVNGVRVPGLPIHGPNIIKGNNDSLVEVGIDRVFSAIQRNTILVFDDLTRLLDELGSYSRELDEMGEPTEKIEAKETFHILDSCRYVLQFLNNDKPRPVMKGSVVGFRGPVTL
jgi:hypothetical protein